MARKRVKKSECPNCSYRFSETNNFCPNCGQENHTHKLPIKHFFAEILEGMLHLDSKTLATLRDLFIPGKITLNYNQNKRVRYVPPVRLYIFISFVFFLLVSFSFDDSSDYKLELKKEIKRERIKHFADSLKNTKDIKHLADSLKNTKDTTGAFMLNQIASSTNPDPLIDKYLAFKKTKITWYNKHYYHNEIKLETGHLSQKEFLHKFMKNASYIMFILMPLFAFYLYLIYWRKKLFYSEHLIFSIHYHSLVFLLLCIWLLFRMFHVYIGLLIALSIFVYTFFIFRKVYGQGKLKTILKLNLLGVVYTISMLFIFVLGVIFSVFL